MKRIITSLAVFGGIFVGTGTCNAEARHTRECSTASLRGAYGSSVGMSVLPEGTPRAVLIRFTFDGRGNFTNTLTINDNGTVRNADDFGTYQINSDCTGTLFTNGGTRTVEIVVVDNGNEFYQMRTDPPNLVFVFNAAKRLFPRDSEEGRGER